MTLLISLFIYLPKILLGFVILHRFWREIDPPSILFKLAVGIPLGLSVSASAFFIAILLGISPNIYSQAELAFELILIVALLPKTIEALKQFLKNIKISREVIMGTSIVFGGFLLFANAFYLYTRMHPHGFEDAWSMWNFVARFIYRSNSPAIFLNGSFYDRFHPDYPVGLNLNVAWGWFILRRETTQIPIALALLSASVPALVIWATMWRWKNIFAGALGVLFIILTLNLTMIVGQYADALFIAHMISTIALLYWHLKSPNGNDGLLTLAGLLAVFSAWSKNEGIVFAGIFIGIYLLASWKHIINRSKIIWFGIGLLLPTGVVLTYKLTVSSDSDLFSNSNSSLLQTLDIARWKIIGTSFLEYILDFGNWPVSAIIVLGLYMIFVGWDQEEFKNQIWILLITVGQFIGYFSIYLITPHDLQLHIHTSMDRLVAHIFSMIVFWAFVAFSPPKLGNPTNSGSSEKSV